MSSATMKPGADPSDADRQRCRRERRWRPQARRMRSGTGSGRRELTPRSVMTRRRPERCSGLLLRTGPPGRTAFLLDAVDEHAVRVAGRIDREADDLILVVDAVECRAHGAGRIVDDNHRPLFAL